MDERLKKLVIIAIQQCKELKIPIDESAVVKINKRAKKRYGVCKKESNKYIIEISSFLFELNDEKVLQTLLHEYLHTCKNCMNHGPQWHKYADKLNNKYHYDIQRTNSRKDMGLKEPEEDEYKYILKCSNSKCDVCIKRMKMTNTIKNYHYYKCAKCGSPLERKK